MAKVIPVSFSNREMELYIYVRSQRNYSDFIKDCIQFYKDNQSKTQNNNTAVNSNNGVSSNEMQNILNF